MGVEGGELECRPRAAARQRRVSEPAAGGRGEEAGPAWTSDAGDDDPTSLIARLADVGVRTFEVTAIDRDGMLGGPDLALYKTLVDAGRGDVIASGGITTADDLVAVREAGCVGAIVGRAIYEGRLRLEDALTLPPRQ